MTSSDANALASLFVEFLETPLCQASCRLKI